MKRISSEVRVFFKCLGVICIIVGIIMGIYLAIELGEKEILYGYRSYAERDWGLTICVFFVVVVPSSFFGALMIAISEVLVSLETICNNIAYLGDDMLPRMSGAKEKQNSMESVSDYTSRNSEISNVNEFVGGWECPVCGKNNRSFAEVCSCGEPKVRKSYREDGTPRQLNIMEMKKY